ncbi:cytidylate kinase [Dyadobacter sp. BE34]|uniref:Cytidylate kinase n=1 Tax=Dyadobacter fermentans TaxID=94254 RepID=A0ABU1R6R6_9BACT|nr:MULTISPECIES: (d)CMP kinase [Dyadobacter]MDR6809100.1 cytidylate kinase [Dyadobacter fermentans]MDR7046843.1 cytidylate kinase [Dyadobacter sp. BE242]MDR7201157.1 cytidylate kinase [Dyadobacter sp. BE34]MDR7219117.1 cytidylate kinase [Dyadobacter sp. BE31]MDR7264673.1 cytidylate kinase [Dyadobacter sp. BE32]
MPKIIVAIDGYSSCGKSTTAKLVAKQLNYPYIDTGAMYRAVTLYFIQNHISLTNPKEVENALSKVHISFRRHPELGRNDTYLNGLNVEDEIRKMYVSERVSEVSAIAEVRHALVAQQQRMGKTKGIVMDGRDIGTVVFPQAELKIFMTADPMIRAHRRQLELMEKGDIVDLGEILENLKTRDYIDTTRAESPLRQAEDAIYIDNSFMTLDEQVEVVVRLADEQIGLSLRRRAADNS